MCPKLTVVVGVDRDIGHSDSPPIGDGLAEIRFVDDYVEAIRVAGHAVRCGQHRCHVNQNSSASVTDPRIRVRSRSLNQSDDEWNRLAHRTAIGKPLWRDRHRSNPNHSREQGD
jgi:hypothetical protein